MSPNDYYLITDGSSYIKNKYYESSSAGMLFNDNDKLFEYGKFHINGTNSLGELYAVYLGLSMTCHLIDIGELENKKINIISDSEYVVKSLNSYIINWSKNSDINKTWVKSNGQPVMYQDIFKPIYYDYLLNDKYNISIYHIKGHVNWSDIENCHIKFNEANNMNIDYAAFAKLISYNRMVDNLANTIRSNKCDYYCGIRKDDIIEWGKRKNLINVNQKRLIVHIA